ncbi:hypothetical protein FGO68_gene3947 [Halteria grandinella]|uniref:Uncharacterized protein n=1 Tax=Halteria grandinella TaxID=5974 RepID=A0A8J8NST0_HALGN|nr:hypothetical protein FGO68_gene3947 [Halteria grandinella]
MKELQLMKQNKKVYPRDILPSQYIVDQKGIFQSTELPSNDQQNRQSKIQLLKQQILNLSANKAPQKPTNILPI